MDNQIPKHPSHPDVPRPSDAELVELACGVCHAIEACGASPELTRAVTLATDLMVYLQKPHLDFVVQTSDSNVVGATHNPVHLAVDLGHAIAKLAEASHGLHSDEKEQVHGLVKSMVIKATELLRD